MAKKPKLELGSFTHVVSAGAQTTPQPSDAEISLDLIDVERQVRTHLGDLSDLVAGIQKVGVLVPIVLLEKDDGR
ncbi:MAG: hypothetical protein ACRETL_13050, partial [Gammaproteobacteria bacterium]